MRLLHSIAALAACASLTNTASAQGADLGVFRSLRTSPPTISGEQRVLSSMETPEGTFIVRDARETAQEHTWQVDQCTRVRPTATMRENLDGGVFVRCRVIEIARTLNCDSCRPYAIPFGEIIFARYTSTVLGEDRLPVLDNWVGNVAVGIRRARLVIEDRRFIVQEWGVSDPSITILEAPITRPR